MTPPKLLKTLGWRKYIDVMPFNGITSDQFEQMMKNRKPQTEIAREMGIHRNTLRPIVEAYKTEQ